MIPAGHIAACREAHRRLLATTDDLTDAQADQPSLLDGWTRAHLLAHLVQHAESHIRLFQGAAVGEARQQYASSDERAGEIERGATQSTDTLRTAVRDSSERLERAWANLPLDAWERAVIVTPGPRPVHELVFRRLREVEVHHADLGLGYSSTKWPAAYVEGELTRRLRDLPNRADRRLLVAWLLNRGPAPELQPW